ncbi:MAG: hypothetical protein LBB42_02680 [Coriobacteriales bacterium]|jgi:hypothetical protein|nr:hypothetical protein [Coriobacteriales bacterium]
MLKRLSKKQVLYFCTIFLLLAVTLCVTAVPNIPQKRAVLDNNSKGENDYSSPEGLLLDKYLGSESDGYFEGSKKEYFVPYGAPKKEKTCYELEDFSFVKKDMSFSEVTKKLGGRAPQKAHTLDGNCIRLVYELVDGGEVFIVFLSTKSGNPEHITDKEAVVEGVWYYDGSNYTIL